MTTYELVIASGRILDGCGNPWYWGDVAIEQGKIVKIAPPGTLKGTKTIDAAGRYVSPGFIDIHTHSDLSILVNRQAESVVRQGVTTELIGNCGMSPAPVSDAHLPVLKRYWGPISDQPEVSWEWRTFGQYLETLQNGGLGDQYCSIVGARSITHECNGSRGACAYQCRT